jgi:hypothetical protein
MKRWSIFTIVGVTAGLSVVLGAADETKMTVADYYLLLPEETFETPARDWLENATVIDKRDGYMSVTGGGAAFLRGCAISLSRSRTRGTACGL